MLWAPLQKTSFTDEEFSVKKTLSKPEDVKHFDTLTSEQFVPLHTLCIFSMICTSSTVIYTSDAHGEAWAEEDDDDDRHYAFRFMVLAFRRCGMVVTEKEWKGLGNYMAIHNQTCSCDTRAG